VEDIKAMRQVIILQAETISGMQVAIGSLQADLAAAMERIEKMAQWAKTKGKTDE